MDQKLSDDTTTNSAAPQPAPTSRQSPEHNQESGKTKLFQTLFIGLIVGVIGFGGGWLGARSYQNEQVEQDAQRIVLDNQGDLISAIAEEVGQSVVSVNVTSVSGQGLTPFGFTQGVESQSAGTGIILNKEGLVVTNRHVVPVAATAVDLVLSDGTVFEDVEVVGRTAQTDPLDVAFLQIKDLKGKKLQPATLADSSETKVGESVIAIGNALGEFQNTVTTGVLSAYGRSVEARDASGNGGTLEDLFQTDAAINQGNSGGPLVNTDGEVIAINTAVASSGENIGFAIPVNNIKGLIKSVEQTGELKRAFLGVVYVSVNAEIRETYDLNVSEGAFIPPSDEYGRDTIQDGSAADEAGIREGDVIIQIEDTKITGQSRLASALGQYIPGETVTVTVDRDGQTERLSVTLGEPPTNTN